MMDSVKVAMYTIDVLNTSELVLLTDEECPLGNADYSKSLKENVLCMEKVPGSITRISICKNQAASDVKELSLVL